jgi:8-oxo-dGTP diphosphatase
MTIRAAGGVLWRREGDRIHVLLVHRPRYDDWSLPKGKREPGETDEQCAVREVFEEAAVIGHLGVELLPARYTDRKGRDKVVRWWVMDVVAQQPFVPGDEIDALDWCDVDELHHKASYRDDVIRAEAAVALVAGS